MSVPTLEEIWANLDGGGARRIPRTLREALEQRVEHGRRQTMEAMLRGLLGRRLGRELDGTEERALKRRAKDLEAARDPAALRAINVLPADALLAWLREAAPR